MGAHHDIRLTIDRLSLSRGDRTLIHGLILEIKQGEALWLTGPNGIGKTTLLLACAGLLRPDDGTLRWVGNQGDIAANQALAFAAHQGPERNGLTLGQELSFWQSLYKDKVSLNDRLASVGLQDRNDTPVAGLSAGQRRRLSLARLMASDRAAWLMDEPLSGLDVEGRALVTETLSHHIAQGGFAIIASHQPIPIKGVTAKKLVLEPTLMSTESGE
jgi:heme exporter protein A